MNDIVLLLSVTWLKALRISSAENERRDAKIAPFGAIRVWRGDPPRSALPARKVMADISWRSGIKLPLLIETLNQ
ncbi:MAG: hypothetical protein ACK4G2_07705 [Novosphingobium sp.]